MNIDIPEYIESRIRQPIPDNLYVVRNSIPVISFGDASQAKVATISINPSDKEFLNNKKQELLNTERRFETLTSLNIDCLKIIKLTLQILTILLVITMQFSSNKMYFVLQ
ncbi:MAG: hypothetical protein AAF298_25190 [Cyanobacteria bacterium P01_A01_bin.40]